MEQSLSFGFIVIANIVAAVLLWREGQNRHKAYLDYAFKSQVLYLVWHLINIQVALNPGNLPAVYLSSTAAVSAGLYAFLASGYGRARVGVEGSVGIFAFVFLAILSLDSYVPVGILELGWMVIGAVHLAVPVATIRSSRRLWLLAVFQFLVAIFLVVGVSMLRSAGSEGLDAGRVFYLFTGILVPACSMTFLIVSVADTGKELVQRSQDYRDFFSTVDEVFFRTGSDGSLTYLSPSVASFGYSEDDLLGVRLHDLMESPVEWSEMGDEWMLETGIQNSSGDFIKSEIQVAAVGNGSGASGYVGTFKNVHERNELQRQFFEAQRKEGLAVLAGGVAHDFNNLMQGVVGQAELMLESSSSDPANRKRLTTIVDAATRSSELCQQLLQYAGKGIVESRAVSLPLLVDEVVNLLTPAAPADVKIRVQTGEGSESILADPTLIQQVLHNITRNALDAVGERGTVSIRVLRNMRDDRVGVEVADDGRGMDKNMLEKIFDPFYSTKAAGYGLGLSAVEGIVSRSGGSIDVKSTPGLGTTFRLLFPRIAAAEAPAETRVEVDPAIKEKTVLLVDDEPAQLEVTSTLLTNEGFKVAVETSGPGAINSFRRDPSNFGVVISDIKMPGMDGSELAAQLRKIDPGVPVILASGYSVQADRGRVDGCVFVAKPFRVNELLGAVQRAVTKSD